MEDTTLRMVYIFTDIILPMIAGYVAKRRSWLTPDQSNWLIRFNIIVIMTHASKDGESKLLSQCSLPLTGAGCIRKVLTDLAYLEIENGAFVLKERAPGVSVEEIVSKTAGKLIVPDHVPEMHFQ